MNTPRSQRGFSLIELAVVLVIVGLLVGGGIAALTAATEQTRRSETKRQLEHVREALFGFAMSRGRLPCADTDGDGEENYDGTNCDTDAAYGGLPWVDLGLGRRDVWGNPFYYAVTTNPGGSVEDFADDPAPEDSTFKLDSSGNLDVYEDDPAGGGVATIAADVPAVVVSFGPQGDQVWTAGGRVACPGPTGFSATENENCDDDISFVDAGYRTSNDPDGRFDDLVIWLSLPLLKSRMVDAGLLP